MASKSKNAVRHRERQGKPLFAQIIDGRSIMKLGQGNGRYVKFTTPRKPDEVYVHDTVTGTQMRLATYERRWGKRHAPR